MMEGLLGGVPGEPHLGHALGDRRHLPVGRDVHSS